MIGKAQLKVVVPIELRTEAKRLARRRRLSLSALVEDLLRQAIGSQDFGSFPDEAAIREMAILLVAELGLKLQEAATPGGVTLSRRLVESAAQSAIERIDFIEQRLREAWS